MSMLDLKDFILIAVGYSLGTFVEPLLVHWLQRPKQSAPRPNDSVDEEAQRQTDKFTPR